MENDQIIWYVASKHIISKNSHSLKNLKAYIHYVRVCKISVTKKIIQFGVKLVINQPHPCHF